MHGEIDVGDAVNRDAALNRGLVGWWLSLPGQQRGNIFRDLCMRNHGALVGGTTWDGLSRSSERGSLKFNGTNGEVNLGSTTATIFGASPSGVTISWWQMPTTAHNSGTWRGIWGATNAGALPEFAAMVFSDNNWYVGFNASGDDDRVTFANTAAIWGQNTWSHFAFTSVIGGTSTLYRNGISIGTKAGATYRTPSDTFRLGRQGTVTNYSSYYLDDVRMYARALGSDEAMSLYVASSTGYPDELNWIRRRTYSFQAATTNRRRRLICGAAA